jgi:hydrogenase maturation protein HypF
MRLEDVIDPGEEGRYEFSAGETIDPAHIIKGVVDDVLGKTDPGKISARFHRTIVDIIIQVANNYRNETGINKVILSGGSFQNRYLLSQCEKRLQHDGFYVFSHRQFPSNDGGIALGQLVIAAKRRETGKLLI